MAYIEFKDINKYFGDNHVLKGINLDINQGDFVTFLGASGCGKSTLLRCLAGLEPVSSGQIFLDGVDITNFEVKDRKIGMVFQQYSLFPNLSVQDNIAFGLKIAKCPKKQMEEKVQEIIHMVELEGKEKQYPAQLSGGQQQRVALARSIIAAPKILLLDEPLSAIDAKLRRALQERIREIHNRLKITTIFVTHDQDEAMAMSDVIHVFNQGIIEQSDRPVDLYIRPKTTFTAGFIGDYNIVKREEFQRLTGSQYSSDVAIRPEIIEITSSPTPPVPDCYHLSGVIKGNLPKGNVLRYYIDVDGVEIKADAPFSTFKIFDDHQQVYLCINKNNCLELA